MTKVISYCQYLDVLSESEDGASGGEEGTSLSNVGGSIVRAKNVVDKVTDALIVERSFSSSCLSVSLKSVEHHLSLFTELLVTSTRLHLATVHITTVHTTTVHPVARAHAAAPHAATGHTAAAHVAAPHAATGHTAAAHATTAHAAAGHTAAAHATAGHATAAHTGAETTRAETT